MHMLQTPAKVETQREPNTHKVTAVKVLEDCRLNLVFADGKSGTINLSHLAGKEVFAL